MILKLKSIKMSNKLDLKDLVYVQNLIRLNADEITMMNGRYGLISNAGDSSTTNLLYFIGS